jgi:hypothetical protein
MTELKRLVLDYRSGELVTRVLYRSSLDGPGPNTKARRRGGDRYVRRRTLSASGQIGEEDSRWT